MAADATRPVGPALGRAASAVLLFAALPAAGALALGLRGYHPGLHRYQWMLFYVLPILWMAGIAIALRASAVVRLSVALALVSLGVAAFLAELGLGIWIRTRPVEGVTRSLRSEVLDIRAAGGDAFPRVPGNSVVDLDPTFVIGGDTLHPITPAPGDTEVLLCNQDAPLISYQADHLGYDNPPETWTAPPTVALVGDSYTAGVCVAREFGLAPSLRARWDVLNLGSSGAGPFQELAVLREYVSRVRPPVVVWVYYEGNDLWDMNRELQRAWLTAYLDPDHSQELALRQAAVDHEYRAWIDSLLAEAQIGTDTGQPRNDPLLDDVLRLRTLRRVAGLSPQVPDRGPVLGPLPDVLTRAREDVAAWGGRLYLAYMPAYERYRTLVGEAFAGHDELKAFAGSADIPFIDIAAAFAETGRPRTLWASPRGHLNPEGYALAAEVIAAALSP